jgi:hypothetical protein
MDNKYKHAIIAHIFGIKEDIGKVAPDRKEVIHF